MARYPVPRLRINWGRSAIDYGKTHRHRDAAVEWVPPLWFKDGMSLRRIAAAAAFLAAVVPGAVRAGPCGDNVDGRDVPCACGDVLVSSVVLDDDPVVNGVACSGDGLIVRNPDSPRTLVVDLHGHRLQGTGAGVGLRVLAGGPGGAEVVSSGGPATIAGFEDGLVARGTDALALLEDVVISRSARDGLRVSGTEFQVRRVAVYEAVRDGFSLAGRGFAIADTRAIDCGRYGYFVMGHSGQVGRPGAGNLAERSGVAGFNVTGSGHAVADCAATFGRKDGVHLQAAQMDVRGCRAADNAGNGIEGMGNDWRLSGNEALRNGGDGLDVRGIGIVDEGGNSGRDNGETVASGAPVQCAISGAACAL